MAIHQIDSKTLAAWVAEGTAQVIDVREPAEFERGHIPGAQLVPLGVLQKNLLGYKENQPHTKMVLHCQHGKRGTVACLKLMAEDPALEIYHLEDGLAAWVEAGYPLETGL